MTKGRDVPDDREIVGATAHTEPATPGAAGGELVTALGSTVDAANAPTLAAAAHRTTSGLAIGQRLGDRYVVRAFLGVGGMGEVYLAFDERLDEEVALKIVRGTLGTSELLRDEVRLAQKVTHENVCRTYDLEKVGELYLLKMEYVAGETLAQRIAREGQMPVEAALRIARAVSAGLAAAHAQRIVHRDLKPGNVMITHAGRVVLMDFGLARRTATESDAAGTPAYMAPEQLAGSEVDARTDLYALGCLVYEMLAGERVFPGTTTTELAAQHMSVRPPDLRLRRRDIPRWLARAVDELLAKEPATRSRGLDRLLSGPRMRRVVLPAIALVTTVIAVVAVGQTLDDAAPASPVEPAWTAELDHMPPFEELSSAPSFSPDGTHVAYASIRDEPGVWRTYVAPVPDGDERMIAKGDGNPRWTRDGKALLLMVEVGNELHVVRQPIDGGAAVDLGPGTMADDCGDAIVLVELDPATGLRLVEVLGDGTRRVLVPGLGDEKMWTPRCDRDGQHILLSRGATHPTGAGNDLYVTDRRGQSRRLTTDRRVAVGTFTPDGREVVFSARSPDGDIHLYVMPATGGPAHQLTTGDGPDLSPDVSADGTRVVFNRTIRSRVVFEGRTAAVAPRQITSRREVLNTVTPVRGGELVVADQEDRDGNRIVAITVATGAKRDLASGNAPFVSLDGTRVFFRSPVAPDTLQVVPIEGGTPAIVATLPGRVLGGFDGPDGQHVEIAGATVQAWRIAPGGQPVDEGVAGVVNPAPTGGWRAVQVAAAGRHRIRLVPPGAALSSPGRELISDSWNNTWLDERRFSYAEGSALRVIDVTTGVQLAEFPVLEPAATFPVLAHDGERWFYTQTIGHVTRHILTNFADRPWKPSADRARAE